MVQLVEVFSLTSRQYRVIGVCFLFVIALTVINLRISLRKSRDAQRKQDVRNISDYLNNFREEYAYFPQSQDGNILGCESGQVDEFGNPIFRLCRWGNDQLVGSPLPTDPQEAHGTQYYYLSSGTHYQVYSALESNNEPEYSGSIVKRNLKCGAKVCNFGLGYKETPLDKSIEEYENELDAKSKK